MKLMKRLILLGIIILGTAGILKSQDFVFKFRNPMFGSGDTFMYQQLLSSAQAQNLYEEEAEAFDPFNTDPLSDFAEDLNRQILSQLSREIISDQFGQEGLQEGTYILGNYQIEVGNTAQGLSVTILDQSTGNQTSILIPYF